MTKNQNPSPSNDDVQLKKQLVSILTIGAVLLVGAAAIHTMGYLGDDSNPIQLADAAFNFSAGIVAFVAAQLLKRGKRVVIYLTAAEGIFAVIFGLAIGRGFNFCDGLLQLDIWFGK